jgi:hypothetical protein
MFYTRRAECTCIVVLIILLIFHRLEAKMQQYPVVIDPNLPTSGQIAQTNIFRYYQTGFTTMQPGGDMNVYFKIEPCSGSRELQALVSVDKQPDYTQYAQGAASRKVMVKNFSHIINRILVPASAMAKTNALIPRSSGQ